MTNLSTTNYGPLANGSALQAIILANNGSEANERIDNTQVALRSMKQVMENEPVGISMFFFVSSALGEGVFSYDVYADIAQRSVLFQENTLVVLLIIGFVICWAAFAAHYLAMSICPALVKLREVQLIDQGTLPEIASKNVGTEKSRNLFIGLLLSIGVLLMVFGFSYMRVNALQVINPEQAYGLMDLALPPLFVAMEIISGIYLSYFLSMASLRLSLKRDRKIFEKSKLDCYKYTNEAVNFMKKAVEREEKVNESKELLHTIYRHEKRSIVGDHYLKSVRSDKISKSSSNGASHPQ